MMVTTTSTRPGRTANIVLWTLQGVMAAAFAMAALTKLAGSPEVVAGFQQIGFGGWFVYAIGVLELAGAIGLLVPRLAGIAALCLCALLVGAIITQLVVFEPATALIPAGYLVPVAVVAWGRRPARQPAR